MQRGKLSQAVQILVALTLGSLTLAACGGAEPEVKEVPPQPTGQSEVVESAQPLADDGDLPLPLLLDHLTRAGGFTDYEMTGDTVTFVSDAPGVEGALGESYAKDNCTFLVDGLAEAGHPLNVRMQYAVLEEIDCSQIPD